ncbi:MAG: serpin family protein [Candidatus Delongbacteria bacterium]
MKKFTVCLLSLIITAYSMELFKGDPEINSGSENIPEGEPAEIKPPAESNNIFMVKAYKVLTEKEKNNNIFISPFSISSALAMTYAGSAGSTESEMAHALEFSKNTVAFHKSFGNMTEKINSVSKKGNLELSIANSLWLAEGYEFLDEFLRINNTYYNTETTNLDFSESVTARKRINDWVAEKTKDKIKDLIPKGILDALTKLVLTNAVYFKAEWKDQFKERMTNKDTFFTSEAKSAEIEMMNQKKRFNYAENDEAQFIEMPYKGNDASMFVLLPKKKSGLDNIEKKLTWEYIEKLTANMEPEQVDVYFPKYKMSLKYELREILNELGMKKAFNKGADFSKMNGNRDLYISAVIHKTFIEVDETGTEAAAATAVVMRMKSAMPDPEFKTFKADHPFFYFIKERSTGAVLFAGRVSNPKVK